MKMKIYVVLHFLLNTWMWSWLSHRDNNKTLLLYPWQQKKNKNNYNNEISVSWNKQWKGYFLSKIIGLWGIRKTRKPNYLESFTVIIVGTDDSHTYLLSNCWPENLTWDTHSTYTFIYNIFAFTKVQPYLGPAPYKPSVPTCFCDKRNVS